MIWEWLFALLDSVLGPVIDALPTATMPEIGATNEVKGWLNTIDYYLPVLAPLRFLINALVAALPALIAYRVGLFVWKRLRG